MKISRPTTNFALLALSVLATGLTPTPASARPVVHKHSKYTARHRAVAHHARVTVTHPKYTRGIGTHGTATTGAGQGTSTNIVPAGGTNSDPLGSGTTSAGTATNGGGVSNK